MVCVPAALQIQFHTVKKQNKKRGYIVYIMHNTNMDPQCYIYNTFCLFLIPKLNPITSWQYWLPTNLIWLLLQISVEKLYFKESHLNHSLLTAMGDVTGGLCNKKGMSVITRSHSVVGFWLIFKLDLFYYDNTLTNLLAPLLCHQPLLCHVLLTTHAQ